MIYLQPIFLCPSSADICFSRLHSLPLKWLRRCTNTFSADSVGLFLLLSHNKTICLLCATPRIRANKLTTVGMKQTSSSFHCSAQTLRICTMNVNYKVFVSWVQTSASYISIATEAGFSHWHVSGRGVLWRSFRNIAFSLRKTMTET